MRRAFKLKTRKWIYAILVAGFPVATYYYPQLAPATPMWLALIMAILNLKPDPGSGEGQ